jgi:23S rRNA (pseudouridine1915-N3)-methyltransferase
MKIRILSVGKTTQKFVLDGEAEYLKRLKTLTRVEIVEISPRLSSSLSADEIRTRECEAILKRLDEREYVIALDEHGKSLSSAQFAHQLARLANEGTQTVTFIIGGAGGLDPAIVKRARLTASLSALTFTYQFARLLLVEQLYRACTIQKGIPYHK